MTEHALKIALADRAAYRLALLAALDDLHDAHVKELRLTAQVNELREEIRRYTRGMLES